MAFLRKSIPLSELSAAATPEDQERHGTEYSGTEGGWVRRKAKPVPGEGNGSGGRLRRGKK
ncbi:hypothetical protein KUG12_15800 [Streptomyces sp. BV333]|uniref:hypothetical protein n=1 Tax=Streptomyces sp. BV333 TaxID=2849673 RepID=UPI001C2E8211|nr:hypothetical protein [Streptomyces sp. BV333]MBV1955794.1 hypothetical protein [Streptomyces sp. BV333]